MNPVDANINAGAIIVSAMLNMLSGITAVVNCVVSCIRDVANIIN